MITYRHSGTLGDLIYSLSVVKKMAPGDFKVALHNIENCVSQYGYRPDEVDPAHKGRFTIADYELLKPLLKRQSYIESVGTWQQGDAEPDVDLDRFRGVLFRGFEGNYVEAYHRTFGLPFVVSDYDTPWLEADANPVAKIVVSRTPRYRSPNGAAIWQSLMAQPGAADSAIFIGTPAEHTDFEQNISPIAYHNVDNFLSLANIVAMGLGRPAVCETIKIKPLQQNECFFPRTNVNYF
jgi:hypothetical protein